MAKEATAPAEPAPAAKKKGLPKTLILIGGITVAEAILFFVAFKLMGGGPSTTHGDEHGSVVQGPEPAAEVADVEVELLAKFRVPNSVQGKTWLYDLDLVVKVPAHRKADMENLKTTRMGEIADSVASIVRSLDPRYLNEPDLKTFRLQVQRALGEIAADPDLIQAVLIPRCVPMRIS